jgi:DNA helicase-2/ATP-dependent DNA helicase PcrA
MESANYVIKQLNNPKLPPAKPVIRHGEPVIIEQKSCLMEIAEQIKLKINSMPQEGFKSAAIICKTMEECLQLKTLLKSLKLQTKVITGSEKEYSGGVVIAPSYLVKGLEFDMVIIANASRKTFSTEELDVKLLYVAMTRPLHRLFIYSCGEPTILLKSII